MMGRALGVMFLAWACAGCSAATDGPADETTGDQAEGLSCAAMLCARGTTCVEHGNSAKCVPVKMDPCATVRCVAGTHCVAHKDGSAECAPDQTCQCQGPAPMGMNYLCDDGVTVAGPACVQPNKGKCSWQIVSCP